MLINIENLIGRDNMKKFLKYWISVRTFTSTTAIDVRETWENWVDENYEDAGDVNDMLAAIDWDDWLNTSTPKFGDDYFATDDVNEAK